MTTFTLPDITNDQLRAAGYTEYEIRNMRYRTDQHDVNRARQVLQGWAYHAGAWQKITSQHIVDCQNGVAEEAAKRSVARVKLDAAKEKNDRQAMTAVLGDDWSTNTPDPEAAFDSKFYSCARYLHRLQTIYQLGLDNASL